MKKFIKKIGSALHQWHDHAYTYWKVHETGIRFDKQLDYGEKVFFLEFRSSLTGDNLTIFDIGAASGVFSRFAAKLPNVDRVYAFEPIPSAFADLTEQTKQYPKIECHNVALGSENSELDIWVTSDRITSSSFLKMKTLHKEELPYGKYEDKPEKVIVVRLDDYVREHRFSLPDVIKVDVQGYEDHVLEGGEATITQAKFVILEMSFVSLYEDSPLFDDIYQKMLEFDFLMVGFGGQVRGVSGRYLQTDGIFQNRRKM